MIAVRNLGVARGGVPLVQGLSFEVGAGQALILKGPNGSGKTSTLRTLVGLQPAWMGRVDLQSEPAFASHADAVKPTLTVRENLEFWSRVYGRASTPEALSAFELTPLADRLAGQLSAGQKRRLGLARLVVSGARIWCLDEPTVSLDAASVACLCACLGAHLAADGAVVVSSHVDLDLRADTLDLAPFAVTADPGPDADPDREAAWA